MTGADTTQIAAAAANAGMTDTGTAERIESLAAQARMFSAGAAMNLLQLGRVLAEARAIVPHGEWTEWVRVNAHMPVRTAQQYMQAYAKFGLEQRYAKFGPSQIIKLLPMTDEEREKLLSENDVADMTAREIERAVRAQREEAKREAQDAARAEIEDARRALMAAERRAQALEAREPEIPRELTDELERNRGEIARLAGTAREALDDANRLREENARLEKDIREQEDILREQQEAVNEARAEILDLKSSIARGDGRGEPEDGLTADAFGRAGREFLGLCASVPFMGSAFAEMDAREKRRWEETVAAVEGWARGARQALGTRLAEGVVVYE